MSDDDVRVPDAIAAVLLDPAAYADQRIHDAYRWLRTHRPLGRVAAQGVDPFWVVTRYDDVREVSRQNALFHNGDRAVTLTSQASDALTRHMTGGSPHLVRSLVQMDAPEHTKYRGIAMSWFGPANVKKLEDRIREIARVTVAGMVGKDGRCDFSSDVALGYPLHVIMGILGVPPSDEPRMLMLTQELFGHHDEAKAKAIAAMTPEQLTQGLMAVVDDFSRYFANISADRRANPRDDLATVIANAQIDGVPISERESLGYYTLIATAGHDTTSSSLAGGVAALAGDPALFARLKADRSLIPGFVDEAIRWTTPVKTFMRTATADTELAGQRIVSGDWLMLCYASANRDESVFEDPDSFRLDRKNARHIAFGHGAHTCLGQHLARVELRIIMEELLDRIDSIELDGEMTMSQSWFVNGPKRMPVRYAIA